MPLRWNVENVKDHETICYETREDGRTYLGPNTERLIWTLWTIGINKITEGNHETVAQRLCMERIIGTSLYPEDVNLYEVAKSHIGMHTNVASITTAKYKGVIYRSVESRAKDLVIAGRKALEGEE